YCCIILLLVFSAIKLLKKLVFYEFNALSLYQFNKVIFLLIYQIMETLAPNIFVSNMQETIAFYRQLGFEVTMSVPDNEEDKVWVMMSNGTVTMMFQTFASLGEDLPQISRKDGGSLLLYINLKNIRSFYESIKDKVTMLTGLDVTFYGATEFSILDNNNYVLTFAEHE